MAASHCCVPGLWSSELAHSLNTESRCNSDSSLRHPSSISQLARVNQFPKHKGSRRVGDWPLRQGKEWVLKRQANINLARYWLNGTFHTAVGHSRQHMKARILSTHLVWSLTVQRSISPVREPVTQDPSPPPHTVILVNKTGNLT